MELLSGKGDELRGELLAMGLEIDLLAHRLLGQYLLKKAPQRRMRCATQVGWSGDSYVLPDEVIGPSAAGVTFQSGERGHVEHTRSGTLAGWRTEIAARSVGNPILVLALSASFAGPLLDRCKAESGGLHLVGDSSTGKTTAIDAACSSWGGPNFRRSWRATANGMEGAAALFNDGLLALDEISECDPREVGAIVYSLGNGHRASSGRPDPVAPAASRGGAASSYLAVNAPSPPPWLKADTVPRPGNPCGCWTYQHLGASVPGTICTACRAARLFRMPSGGLRQRTTGTPVALSCND
jgi:putative DNA primase/helicase